MEQSSIPAPIAAIMAKSGMNIEVQASPSRVPDFFEDPGPEFNIPEAEKVLEAKPALQKIHFAEIVEHQIRMHLDKFKARYNAQNEYDFFSYNLLMKESTKDGLPIRTLELGISRKGQWHLAYRQSYSFSHPAQVKDEGEWKLALYDDLLYNLIGGGLAHIFAISEARQS